jgi:hypothetical protein
MPISAVSPGISAVNVDD